MKTNKTAIDILNKKKAKLNEQYRAIAIEKIKADEEFNKRLAATSGLIHEVDREILMVKMPIEMEN